MESMLKVPCFLCRNGLEIRTDKNGKRYLVCDDCGIQAFIRRKPGITLLEKLARDFKGGKLLIALDANLAFDAQAAITEIQNLKREIKKLKRQKGFFSTDADSRRAIKALRERVSALLSMLEKHAKDVRAK
jgi:hypothetical protein